MICTVSTLPLIRASRSIFTLVSGASSIASDPSMLFFSVSAPALRSTKAASPCPSAMAMRVRQHVVAGSSCSIHLPHTVMQRGHSVHISRVERTVCFQQQLDHRNRADCCSAVQSKLATLVLHASRRLLRNELPCGIEVVLRGGEVQGSLVAASKQSLLAANERGVEPGRCCLERKVSCIVRDARPACNLLFMLTSASRESRRSTSSSASFRLAAIISGVQPEPSCNANQPSSYDKGDCGGVPGRRRRSSWSG